VDAILDYGGKRSATPLSHGRKPPVWNGEDCEKGFFVSFDYLIEGCRSCFDGI
jgi:hypothetical protein